MANYNTPWNKGIKMSDDEKKKRRQAYYLRNKDRIKSNSLNRAKLKSAEIKEYMRWRGIKLKYGLTKEQWLSMYNFQHGKCGICQTNQAAVVDHCHKSGKVRKLLCNRCNLLMGYIDNEPLLKAALGYKLEFK